MESFDRKDVVVYHNLFPVEDCWKILEYLNRPKWAFGHGSVEWADERKSTPFWVMDLNSDTFFTDYLLNIIREKTNQKFSLERVYANGHMFGTQGEPHQDSGESNGRTFLFYANDNWSIDWGGKTVFLLNSTEQHYESPNPNKGVIFPGRMFHYAESTTRKFIGLRITVAWKLYLEE
jgi:hypothetical protein